MRVLSHLFGCLRLFLLQWEVNNQYPFLQIRTKQWKMQLRRFSLSPNIDFVCGILVKMPKKKKLAGLYSNHDFHESFNKCLYGNMNVMEFEATWSAMIEKHKQQNNDWLNRLYHVWENWCPSFNVDFFQQRWSSPNEMRSQIVFFIKSWKLPCRLFKLLKFMRKSGTNASRRNKWRFLLQEWCTYKI